MKLKIKKTDINATVPTRAHATDAGFDLYSLTENKVSDTVTTPVYIQTGISVEIPKGYFGIICARSSTYKNFGFIIPNAVGIIDSDYRGELMVLAINPYHSIYKDGQIHYRECVIAQGSKIAQLIVLKLPSCEIEEVSELSETERGTNGFGSSGK